MSCCCKPGRSNKSAASCLGRCDLPKHRCLDYEDVKPGPVPKHMGWLYTAKDSPQHQLRCGWRPGHISCTVLRKIEQHNCEKQRECNPCIAKCGKTPCPKPPSCTKPPCISPCPKSSCGNPCPSPGCTGPKCLSCCPSSASSCCAKPPCSVPLPMIRIVRHNGQYSICTKPSNISNAPSGPYPLKYVLNTDDAGAAGAGAASAKYSVEGKYNDYHFDYTSSQSSFVLDFSPPDARCSRPCPKRSLTCMMCS